MKSTSLYLLILSLFWITSISYGSNIQSISLNIAADTLKVVTYNVHHCNPPSQKTGLIDLDTITGVIKKLNPDIVALEEIDDHTSRSGAFNEAEVIAEKLKMYVYFAKAIDYGGGGYGVAILSRYPLLDPKTYPLPNVAGFTGEARVLALVKVSIPGGKIIRFGCTHLDVTSQANRELQVTEISRIASLEPLPFIIGGDFNEGPGGNTLNLFDTSFTRSCITGCGFTFPNLNPDRIIDYVAFRPSSDFMVVKHSVIDEQYASDHLPVLVHLILK